MQNQTFSQTFTESTVTLLCSCSVERIDGQGKIRQDSYEVLNQSGESVGTIAFAYRVGLWQMEGVSLKWQEEATSGECHDKMQEIIHELARVLVWIDLTDDNGQTLPVRFDVLYGIPWHIVTGIIKKIRAAESLRESRLLT